MLCLKDKIKLEISNRNSASKYTKRSTLGSRLVLLAVGSATLGMSYTRTELGARELLV